MYFREEDHKTILFLKDFSLFFSPLGFYRYGPLFLFPLEFLEEMRHKTVGEKGMLRFVSSLKPQHYAFSGCAAARRSCSSLSSSCCSSYYSSRRSATTRCHATRAKDDDDENDDENDATKPVKKSIISSVENANVKRLVKLRTSKAFRDEERSVVVVGSTVLKEILRDGKTKVNVKSVYALEDDDDGRVDVFENDHKVFFSSSSSYGATAKVMKKLAGVENADGIDLVAELEMPEIRTVSEFMKRKNTRSKIDKVLCMDGVQDPGNVGTLLRTAEAFGFDAVGLGPRTCDPFNDKCMRSSKGTAFRMQMFNWKTSEEFFEGIVNDGKFELKENVLAAMLSGESCVDVSRELNNNNNSDSNDYRSHTKVCLVLGSEGQGVSKEIASSTRAVTIPTPGVTESLNVAVAGGILMSSLTIR